MTEEKRLFLGRLIEAVTLLGYPPRGRQTQLAKHYKITQGAVRKWFAAETMPSYEICIDICKRSHLQFEWFMTGRGDKRLAAGLPLELATLLERYERADDKTKLMIDLALQDPNAPLPDEISPSIRHMLDAIRSALPPDKPR